MKRTTKTSTHESRPPTPFKAIQKASTFNGHKIEYVVGDNGNGGDWMVSLPVDGHPGHFVKVSLSKYLEMESSKPIMSVGQKNELLSRRSKVLVMQSKVSKARGHTAKQRKATSWNQFQKLGHNWVKTRHPDWTSAEISRELGKQWKNMRPSEKAVYERSAIAANANLWRGSSSSSSTGSSASSSSTGSSASSSSSGSSASSSSSSRTMRTQKASGRVPVSTEGETLTYVPLDKKRAKKLIAQKQQRKLELQQIQNDYAKAREIAGLQPKRNDVERDFFDAKPAGRVSQALVETLSRTHASRRKSSGKRKS